MDLTTGFLVEVSLYVIYFSLGVIILVLIYLIIVNAKSSEEKKAREVFKKFERIKKSGVTSSKKSESDKKTVDATKSKKSGENKKDSSLKNLLIKKFKPKLETQLGSKVEIMDFSSDENNLFALIEVSGVRINLVLDLSGKIVDYKKI